MANPFYVEPVNPLQALMLGQQGFDKAQERSRQGEADTARREAAKLYAAGDAKGAIARLMSGGDPRLISALGQYQGVEGVFGTPIFTSDGGVAAITRKGELKPLQMPQGVQALPGIKTVDTGTGTQIISAKSGVPIGGGIAVPGQPQGPTGYIPRDVAGKARESKVGAGEGEAIESLASIKSKMPGLQKVVKELDELSNKATYTTTGRKIDTLRRELGAEPRESAIARAQYISMVDNQILPLLRDTFGPQFTQREGETLRATLGNPDLSPKEKQAVLKSFIEQKMRDVEALESRTKTTPAAQPSIPKGMKTRKLGGKEYFQAPNGQWYEQ